MKAYLIERNDSVGYDEYDSCLVIAESPEHALQLAKSEYKSEISDWDGWTNAYSGKDWDVTVSEVDMTEPHVVIGSFNAG